jgi:hypothetical protein
VHPSALLASHHSAAHALPWALILTGAILGAAGWYALMCAEVPFRKCWHCGRTGRNGPGARSRCKHCDGTGLRLRHGRHLFNHLSRTRDGAARADHQRHVDEQRRRREDANPWKDTR